MAASVWRGRITFGLVAIPVRLVKAARRERTRFRRVQRANAAPQEADEPEEQESGARVLPFPSSSKTQAKPVDRVEAEEAAEEERVVRVRNTPVSALTDQPVAPAEILKGYEVSKDAFVVLQPDEVAALRPQTSSEVEITEFVKAVEIDPLYFETSYYVVPEAGGEKPYGLLFAALRETGNAGLGSLAMHGRQHVVAIRAGRESLVLHVMFYENELGRAAHRVEGEPPGAKELELAKMLVGALEAKFEPAKWKDVYEERLRALIESRPAVAGSAAAKPAVAAESADLMEALRKSLQIVRKAPGSAGVRRGRPAQAGGPAKTKK
jgi:DNA end-binding protein Ku